MPAVSATAGAADGMDDRVRRDGLCMAGFSGCILAVSAVVRNTAWLPSACLFRNLTGLPCPLCGATRAFVCMGHGDLAGAVAHHAAAPLLFGLTACLFALGAAQAGTGRPLLARVWGRVRRVAVPSLTGVIVAAWIANLVR